MPRTVFPALTYSGFHHKKLHIVHSYVFSMKLEEEVTLGVKNCSQACSLLNQNTQSRAVKNPTEPASASWFSNAQVRF